MSTFGITPEHLQAIAGTWEKAGQELSALSFGSGGEGTTTSEGLVQLRRCGTAAGQSAVALGVHLDALGRAVRHFDALTRESDAAAGVALRTASR